MTVSTGWNVTVATHAAAPPATAERRKEVSRDSDTAGWHGAALDRRRESAARLAEGAADLATAVLEPSSTTQAQSHRTTMPSAVPDDD